MNMGNAEIPEYEYTTKPGTVDREAEEKVIEEEKKLKRKAEQKRRAMPPTLDELPPQGYKSDDLEPADPIRVDAWQRATNPGDATEERMRKSLGKDESEK